MDIPTKQLTIEETADLIAQRATVKILRILREQGHTLKTCPAQPGPGEPVMRFGDMADIVRKIALDTMNGTFVEDENRPLRPLTSEEIHSRLKMPRLLCGADVHKSLSRTDSNKAA